MKKHLFQLVIGLCALISSNAFAQDIVYSEDFDGVTTWTINTDLTAEGAAPNEWYISCMEEGVGSGVCGSACIGAGNLTLHVGSNSGGFGDMGAAYLETGTGGTTTNRRAESADISTIGDTDLTLNFDLIGQGGGTDFAEVFYSIDGGATWTSIASPLTSMCCGGVPCTGVEQGLWLTNNYPLPMECEGIPNLRISFVWQNIDDGVATDPSFAVDNITITKPAVAMTGLVASFAPERFSICVDDCITFTDMSTGMGIVGHAWTFSDPLLGGPIVGADPGSICFPTVGDVDVTLTITDGVAADDTTITISVSDLPTVTANTSSTTICTDGTVTLTGTGDALAYTWDMGVVDGAAFTLGTTTTFTVTGFNNVGCMNTDMVTVTVVDCEPIISGFRVDPILCVGDCITLVDTSSGDPTSWLWDFGGGADPAMSTEQNPFACFTTAGIFNIQLTVTNALGQTSSTTNTITVFDSPTVSAEQDTIIDLPGCADLIAVGSLPDGDYTWSPDDFVECENCPITKASPPRDQVYTVTLTDVNGCIASDSVRVMVNFVEQIGVPDAFSPNGDGNNDILFVRGFGLRSVSFSVFNKYGEKVFETDTQDIGWDGTFKNREENPGVFTWVAEFQFIGGNTGRRNGTVTLLR